MIQKCRLKLCLLAVYNFICNCFVRDDKWLQICQDFWPPLRKMTSFGQFESIIATSESFRFSWKKLINWHLCLLWMNKKTHKTKQERWDWNLTISFYTGVVQSHYKFTRWDVNQTHRHKSHEDFIFIFHFEILNHFRHWHVKM